MLLTILNSLGYTLRYRLRIIIGNVEHIMNERETLSENILE